MSELLLPEFLWQTLAWSVLFVVLAVLALQHSSRYTRSALGLFFTGLTIAYVFDIFIDRHPPLLSTAVMYLGVLGAFAVFAIGCYFVYEFFKKQSVTIKPEVNRDLSWIGTTLRKKHPIWLYGIAGLATGLFEPLRLTQYYYNQRYLLLEQAAPEHILTLIYAVFTTLLPMFLIVLLVGGVYLFLSRKKNTDSHNHLLLAGHSYIIISWLLVAVSAGFLRI